MLFLARVDITVASLLNGWAGKAGFFVCTLAKYFATDATLKKAEWRAVYYENNMRLQLGMSLRTHYGLKQQADGSYLGNGQNLLDISNKSINYPIK